MQALEGLFPMLTLDYKLDGTTAQYAAIEEGIRTVQFIRNKCLRAWMDRLPEGKNFEAMSEYTAVLEKRVCVCQSVRLRGTAGQCWTGLGSREPLLRPVQKARPWQKRLSQVSA